MINQIETYLDSFTSIDLRKLNKVALLDRLDSKYVLPTDRLPELFDLLSSDYYILMIEGTRIFDYSTLYYDTPDTQMYYNHVRGKLNRFKVRIRKYNTTGENFLEVKFKNNKNRTIKYRYEQPFDLWINAPLNTSFLSEFIPYDPSTLCPVVENNFKRITLADKSFTHRVTIDYQLSFHNGFGKLPINKDFPHLAIVELKKPKESSDIILESVLRKMRVLPTGFSKYCFGKLLTEPSLTHAKLLKPRLRKLEKMTNYAVSFN